jgi:dimeric dUTPase (all-alpha-NTP-PPase superfamily)
MLEQWKDKPFSCYNFTKQEFDLFYSIDNAIEELGEARRLLNRKSWKNAKITINRKKILEELIDAEKFINQCKLLLGFDVIESFNCHMKKDKINHKRQKRGY